jgi:hypothetical protein
MITQRPTEYTKSDHKSALESTRKEIERGEYFHDYIGALNEAARVRKFNTPLMKRITRR